MMSKRLLSVTIIGTLVGTFITAGIALAVGPTERIKQTTDKIIAILNDPALKGPEKARERKMRIRAAVDERFDWEEFSRRALARYWRERTKQEKEEFVPLFGNLVERTYMDKVENYSGEKVVYAGERIQGKYGLVKAKVVTSDNREISVDYRLRYKGNDWFVYDVSVEGVSLVNNYRVQFSNIIRNSSYEALVKRLKDKLSEEQEEGGR